MSSIFETLEPKTTAEFEVFGYTLVELMKSKSTSPNYSELLNEFLVQTLQKAPSTHKSFEKALIAAIQKKDAEEKAAREKAEVKQKGLGKFREKVTAKDDDDEDEEDARGTTQQVLDDAELERLAKEEEEEKKREVAKNTSLAKKQAEEEKRRLENEKILAEKARKVEATAIPEGFEVVMPAWDDKKKKKKGGW